MNDRKCVRCGFCITAGVAVALCLLAGVGPARAQLAESDIAALRERGQREGWTFTVAESEATSYPLSQLCGAVLPPDWPAHARYDPCGPRSGAERSLPAAWDWRSLAHFPDIRNQAGCGSCWAFSAVGAMECALAREADLGVDLSEQWLVSCNQDGMSCAGGSHVTAMEYLLCSGAADACGGTGAVLETAFPYVAWDAPCRCPYAHPYCLDSWFGVGTMWSAPTPAQLKQAIYDHGPLNVTVYVNTAFQAYHEGVFNACESQIINHAVVLVGWDDNQGPEGVWILRNSWGTNWGEGGYMRIAYGCCRVGYAATYVNYFAPDCNSNGIRDEQDLADGTSLDCNLSGAPDECEPGGSTDCNGNGVSDLCDIFTGSSGDCNGNGIPDDCEIASGSAPDCNANGVPDTCELNVLYVLDDGALDSGLGFGEGTGHLIWLNTFIVTPGGETVDAIDVAWGWVTAGTPTTLALWLDPTGDRDPHDARLLWQSAHPVPAADPATDLFTTVLVPPVHVGEPGEVFCVGAYIHADQYPAAFDLSVYPGHAWAAVGKNLAHLDANESLGCLDDWVGRGVWSLRAHTVSGDANGNGVPDECDGRPGDLNCDGRVDNFDITPFVLALASTPPDYPEYYGTYLECQRELADINGDGRVDNFDISPFVSLLIGR